MKVRGTIKSLEILLPKKIKIIINPKDKINSFPVSYISKSDNNKEIKVIDDPFQLTINFINDDNSEEGKIIEYLSNSFIKSNISVLLYNLYQTQELAIFEYEEKENKEKEKENWLTSITVPANE